MPLSSKDERLGVTMITHLLILVCNHAVNLEQALEGIEAINLDLKEGAAKYFEQIKKAQH